MKTPHAWNVADIVSSVFSQSAANGQRLYGQNSPCNVIALRTEDIRQNTFYYFVRLGSVGRRNYHLPRLPLPCEENPNLRLWYRDNDKRFGVGQNFRRLEREVCKTFLIELSIQ
jgi:hypothetical protein